MRTANLLSLAVLLLAGCSDPPPPAEPPLPATLIRDARVFDGAAVFDRADVLLRGDRIAQVGPDLAAPAGARVVDGRGKTLLPGLIDAHFHICYREQLEEAAAAGITTVLDMGSDPRVGRRLKDALRSAGGRGLADLRVAGNPVTVPGGYGTEKGVPVRTLEGPAEADAFVEARIAEGSDYIKVLLDDGAAFGHRIPALDRATMEAAVAAAHRRGKIAVVHISAQRDAREAIEAGIDGLAHIFFDAAPDADFAALAKHRGVFVVPTLTQGRGPGLKHARAAVRQLRDAGVPILAGADAGNTSLLDELALLVEAGLTPVEALAAATSLPAKHFGLPDRGRIAAGLRADLVLVDGDPTADVAAARNVVAVWREGEAVDRAASLAAPAARRRDGRVSDFEDEDMTARFGGWRFQTDSEMGGASVAELRRVSPGAEGSGGALEIAGDVRRGRGPRAYAGAQFTPGVGPGAAADLSAMKELVFRARGDGRKYAVGLFAENRGQAPALVEFSPGKEWQEFRLPLRSFQGYDGKDLTAVFFGTLDPPGAFRLQLDDVEFR